MTINHNIQKELTIEQQTKILTSTFFTSKKKIELNSEIIGTKNLFSMSKSKTPSMFYPTLMSEKTMESLMPFLDLRTLKKYSAEIFKDSNYPRYGSSIMENYYIAPYMLEEDDMTEENKPLLKKWFELSEVFANLFIQKSGDISYLSSFKAIKDEKLDTFNIRLKEVRDLLVQFHDIAIEINKNNMLFLFKNESLNLLTTTFWEYLAEGILLKNIWKYSLDLESFKDAIHRGIDTTEDHKKLFLDTNKVENLDLVVINNILLKIIKKQDDFLLFEDFILSNKDSFLQKIEKRTYKKKSLILADDLWLKSLKKVFKKNELTYITKKQNEYVSSDNSLDTLKMLEYNTFSIKEEFLLKVFKSSNNPKVLTYVENILIEHGTLEKKKEYDYFTSELPVNIYRTYISLNWESLKSRVSHNNLIASNILATYIRSFKLIEKEKNKEYEDVLSWEDGKDDEIIFIFESINKESTENFKNVLLKYIEFSFSKDFLTKETLHILNLKTYNTNDYKNFVNAYIEKSKVMVFKKELEKGLVISEKKEKRSKL